MSTSQTFPQYPTGFTPTAAHEAAENLRSLAAGTARTGRPIVWTHLVEELSEFIDVTHSLAAAVTTLAGPLDYQVAQSGSEANGSSSSIRDRLVTTDELLRGVQSTLEDIIFELPTDSSIDELPDAETIVEAFRRRHG